MARQLKSTPRAEISLSPSSLPRCPPAGALAILAVCLALLASRLSARGQAAANPAPAAVTLLATSEPEPARTYQRCDSDNLLAVGAGPVPDTSKAHACCSEQQAAAGPEGPTATEQDQPAQPSAATTISTATSSCQEECEPQPVVIVPTV